MEERLPIGSDQSEKPLEIYPSSKSATFWPHRGPGKMSTMFCVTPCPPLTADYLPRSIQAAKLRVFTRETQRWAHCLPPDRLCNAKIFSKFEKLSEKQKYVLLVYHGLPEYQPESMLRGKNNTPLGKLASERASRFNLVPKNVGKEVKMKTELVTARIVVSLIYSTPLAIDAVDKVLLSKV